MTSVTKSKLIAHGKAKSLYATDKPDVLVMEFRDDTSAYDGKKTAKLANKGEVNNRINETVMVMLQNAGIETHFLERISPTESLVRRLDMLPLEAVVRNIGTGSLCRRLGIEDKIKLSPPLFEWFLKNDDLGDPLVNEDHIVSFGWADAEQIQTVRKLSLQANAALCELFMAIGIILVDFKLEFGVADGALVLGDEFTPDGCRLWDAETREVLDKDRFRHDMGAVVDAYQQVAQRLQG